MCSAFVSIQTMEILSQDKQVDQHQGSKWPVGERHHGITESSAVTEETSPVIEVVKEKTETQLKEMSWVKKMPELGILKGLMRWRVRTSGSGEGYHNVERGRGEFTDLNR